MCGILNNHVNHLSSPDSKKTTLDDYGNRSILKTAWLFIHIYILAHVYAEIYSYTMIGNSHFYRDKS